MLKQLGLKQEEIEAEEVIIKCKDKKLIIKNPNVTKMNVQGQEMFQVTGDIEESEDMGEEDVKMVASQANVNETEAREALKKSDGNLAEAILLLKK